MNTSGSYRDLRSHELFSHALLLSESFIRVRWSPRKKKLIVGAVLTKIVTPEEVERVHGVSAKELRIWIQGMQNLETVDDQDHETPSDHELKQEDIVHVVYGDIRIDPQTRTVVCGTTKQIVSLTRLEYQILKLLMKQDPHTMLSQKYIQGEVYKGRENVPELKIIDIYIYKIRKKLRSIGTSVSITTVHGRGYGMTKGSSPPFT
jgi:DNA-binding response OmpR family regulator